MARATTNHRTILGGAVVAAVLVLGGCGDDSDEAFDDIQDMAQDSMPDAGDGAETDTGTATNEEGERELEPLTFFLPEESEPADGFARVPASCEAPEEFGAVYTFAVPEAWEATGRGGGGSGSPLSSSVELRFTTEEGEEVSVDVEPERRHPDGSVLDSSGEPFESFDYDWSSSDGTSGTITFDSVDTVAVGDQDVEIFVAEQDQEPEMLSSTEYKARMEVAELPNPAAGDEDKVRPASVVVTVEYDSEDLTVEDETVSEIIGSFALPDCTRERIVVEQEVSLGADLDGDGEVSEPEDLRVTP